MDQIKSWALFITFMWLCDITERQVSISSIFLFSNIRADNISLNEEQKVFVKTMISEVCLLSIQLIYLFVLYWIVVKKFTNCHNDVLKCMLINKNYVR